MLEAAIAVVMILGTFLTAVASIGLVRFPDVYCRMHAAGKAGTLGVSLLILAATGWLAASEPTLLIRGLLAIGFQFLTTPAATHLLARASYLTQYPLSERTAVDELRTYLPSRPHDTFGRE